jgi:L-2-hydroxyglutarate oxidase LhgO
LRSDDGSCLDLVCRNLVNCAGHGAHSVAQLIAGFDKRHLPPRYLAKGSYCSVIGKSPFARLIYPIPVSGALGVHLTLDLAGHARLGPDIEWVDELEYSMRPGIEDDFARACQPFWPGVTSHRLVSDYCGVRPKLHGSQANFADFEVQGSTVHGVDGLINLFGIESPGLTSSLAIGELIEQILSRGKL